MSLKSKINRDKKYYVVVRGVKGRGTNFFEFPTKAKQQSFVKILKKQKVDYATSER